MVAIRAYREDDRDALRALVLALHEEVRPLDADLAPGETILDAHFEHLQCEVVATQGTIFVAEDAGHLVGYACDLARRIGAPKLELKVHAGNTQAQRYYERLGFTIRWLTMTRRYE